MAHTLHIDSSPRGERSHSCRTGSIGIIGDRIHSLTLQFNQRYFYFLIFR
jgi:hypothetical protein